MKYQGAGAILFLVVLAGCDGGSPTDGNEIVAEAQVTAPVERRVIDAPFTGIWDSDRAACNRESSPMRLIVANDAIRVGEDIFEIEAVTEIRDARAAVYVDATSTGDGITESRRYRLEMAGPDAIAMTVREETSQRIRCSQQ